MAIELTVLTEYRHVDELTHHPRLNVNDMENVKYIHEFDRYVPLFRTRYNSMLI